MNLSLMFAKTVKKFGDRTAIVMGDRQWSYAGLEKDSNKVANTLLKLGLKRGDRVTLLLSNIPEFITLYLGIVKIGATAVPLDTRYTVYELSTLINHSQSRMLVIENGCLEPLMPALFRFKSIERIIEVGAKSAGKFLTYQEIMATGSAENVKIEVPPAETAHIIYTSGSTAHPRGVALSHYSAVADAEALAATYKLTENDTLTLFALPLYHAFGLQIVTLSSFSAGSKVVIVPGLSLDNLFEIIEKERVTTFMGVPYIFTLAINKTERDGVKNDLSSLRLCVSAGSALPDNVARRFKQYYNRDIVQLYGLTECVGPVISQPIDDSGKLGSVGMPLSIWRVKIVDDSGRELPPNNPGEVVISGPFMDGYYANPQDTAQIIKNGWLYTGDIGRIDEDGEVFILGLKKELIIIKGQNIYPGDIEEVLSTHPKVAEAAVVGVYDELRGEKIRAVVSLKVGEVVTERELKDYCRQYLANYKIPKEIVFVSALPRTATGQVRKEDFKS